LNATDAVQLIWSGDANLFAIVRLSLAVTLAATFLAAVLVLAQLCDDDGLFRSNLQVKVAVFHGKARAARRGRSARSSTP